MASTEVVRHEGIIRSRVQNILSSTVLSCGSSSITSSTFTADGYRKSLAMLTVSDTGSTDTHRVQFIPQFKDATGSNWFDYREGVWASMIFSGNQLQDSTFRRAHTLPLDGRTMRFNVVRESTQATGLNMTVTVDLEAMN